MKTIINICMIVVVIISILFVVYISDYMSFFFAEKITESSNVIETTNVSDIEKLSLFIKKLNPKVDKKISNIISESIITHCGIFSPYLITGLIFRESSFNYMAISKSNCVGLMQINPKAHPKKVKGENLYEIDTNIRIGCQILKEYFNRKNDIQDALKRYVGGNEKDYIIDILSIYTNYEIMKGK